MKLLKYLIILLSLISSVVSSEIELTKDEIQWIKNNPTVHLGADYKWPPFDFIDSKGSHTGLSSEYIKLISKKSNLKFEVHAGVWSEVLENMKAKKYDGLTCAVETDDRKKYLTFSIPYLSVPMVIITQTSNRDIKTIEDLFTKSVSINKGSYIHEWLQKSYPEINLHLTTSNEASLEAVSLGEADAYVGNLAVATYIMNKYLINNLQIVKRFKEFETAVSIAIDKENKILFNIVQKSLNSITPQEHQEIKNIWKKNLSMEDTPKQEASIILSENEKIWIKKNNNKIKICVDPDWMPYEKIESAKYIGIGKDIYNLFEDRLGVKFELLPTKSWSQSVEFGKKRKCDILSFLNETEDRKSYLNFTTPIYSNIEVLVSNSRVSYLEDLKSLNGKELGVINGYSTAENIVNNYPDIKLVYFENQLEALKSVSDGSLFATVGSLTTMSYLINTHGLGNLKIAGKTNYSNNFRVGVRNDDEILFSIMQKVVDSLSEKDINRIKTKWLSIKYEHGFDYTLLWQVIGVFILLIIASLFWNRKLSAEITKRKIVQEELIEINKKLEEATAVAQSANRAKSDFLSNMSHEIRTPMNAILGFAELLDEKIEDKKLKSFVRTIRSSGQALLFLINDILDLSKIESGKLALIISRTNLQNMFEETINIFKLQAEQKGLKLELTLDKDLPKALLFDQVRLKEILINLIGNALKFTEEGYIKVVVVVDEVYEHRSKIDLTITVKDSGVGILKSNQEKIFNIFEQSENQDTKKYGGTGLGLSISRKLAILMGGSLDVESELGEGSNFIVSLKNIDIASLIDENIEVESKIDYNFIKFESAVILIVDDIKENRDLIKESFHDTDIKVIEASNGKEAIDIAKKEELDLILMDIRMPVMDGYTATRLIKEFSSVSIVALTASIMQDELKKLECDRFNGYLRKPVSKEELFKEVSKYIKYKTNITENIEENISITNIEGLISFLNSLEPEIEMLYKEAKSTNNISVITDFSKALLALSLKYNVEYMINYSELLLEKIDAFEIDSISMMLNDFEQKIEALRVAIKNF